MDDQNDVRGLLAGHFSHWPRLQPRILTPLSERNFRLLWAGQAVSLLGDQFFFIAMAWLAMRLTGSGLALGTVLMAVAIPRALFMLAGGAVTDRHSPRSLMLVSNAMRAVLTLLLTALVVTDRTQLWQLYVLSAGFGLVDAFFYPAYSTIVPGILPPEQLEAGNAILFGTMQLATLLGPVPAGLLVARAGTGAAFAFDAVTFAFAAVTVLLMRRLRFRVPSAGKSTGPSGAATVWLHGIEIRKPKLLLADIRAGLGYAFRDPLIRSLILLVAVFHLAIDGPIFVGITALANQRFTAGPAGLGIMLSAWGAGSTLGALLGGHMRPRRRGRLVMTVAALVPPVFILLAFLPNIAMAAGAIALIGVGSGFWSVVGTAWAQKLVTPEMRGRVMSMVMLASAGIVPFSYVAAGWLVDLGLNRLFVVAGVAMLVPVLAVAGNRAVRDAE